MKKEGLFKQYIKGEDGCVDDKKVEKVAQALLLEEGRDIKDSFYEEVMKTLFQSVLFYMIENNLINEKTEVQNIADIIMFKERENATDGYESKYIKTIADYRKEMEESGKESKALFYYDRFLSYTSEKARENIYVSCLACLYEI